MIITRSKTITQEKTCSCTYKDGLVFILPSWVIVPDWIIDQNIGYCSDSHAFRIIEKYDEEGFVEFKEDGNYLLIDPDDVNDIPEEDRGLIDVISDKNSYVWLHAMYLAEDAYITLINNKCSLQQACSVLPMYHRCLKCI